MCGIVGYLGKNNAGPILLDGLKRLEYRGYDSAGLAVLDEGRVFCLKAVGKIKELDNKVGEQKIVGRVGIAHTRWATHGQPTEANAHPHPCCQGKIWVVHNGIIENYQKLKSRLEAKGHQFKSDTDTEVISHLLEDLYDGDLVSTLQKALKLVRGAYGLVILHADEPEKLVAAKCGSPLVVGLGEGETIIASDVSAIISHTRQVIYLEDGEIAAITADNLKVLNLDNQEIDKTSERIEWDIDKLEKNGFAHFMLKEIFEQPETVVNSLRGRVIAADGKVKLGGLENVKDKLREIKRIIIVACGTAYYAGLVGKNMLEEYAGIPTTVEQSSEFRYRQPLLDRETAVIAISQSGETADTLAAVKEAREKDVLTLGIVNTVGSSIARATAAGVYNHIGPEIAVASTKAFVSQVVILALLTVFLGRQRNMSLATGQRIIKELELLPDKIKKILATDELIKEIAGRYCRVKHFAFLGRKYNCPLAFEGALKLKEISYIHAEGYPAGEMKHGPIALIDEHFPSLFIAPLDSVYEKNISNMEEIKSRQGRILALTTDENEKIKSVADDVMYIPKTLEMLTPVLAVIPLQLFAYHTAVARGCDVDKPRNLAKSVTVE